MPLITFKGKLPLSILFLHVIFLFAQVRVQAVLTFPAPADMIYGDVVTLEASDDAGASVQFEFLDGESSGSATLDGDQLTATGVGTIAVRAFVADSGESLQHTLNVSQKALTVYAMSQSKIVGDPNPELSVGYAGFVLDDTEAVVDTPAVPATTVDDATAEGTYEITISGGSDDNYLLEGYHSGSFLVKPTPGHSQFPQALTFPETGPSEYGDTETLVATSDSNLPISYEIVAGPGTLSEDELTATGVGVIIVRATQAGTNRRQAATPVEQTFVISPAPLTISAVDTYRKVNEADPVFVVSYSGFKFEDTDEDLDSPASVTSNAAVDSLAGVYELMPAGAADPNYSFVYESANLYLTEFESQTLTLPPVDDFDYGASMQLQASADSGLPIVYTFLPHQSSGAVEINGDLATGTRAGVVTVEVSQPGNDSFNPVVAHISFSILPIPLTVIADDQFRRLNKDFPEYSFSYTGFLPGDSELDLDELPTATTDAEHDSPVGDYTITPSGGADVNYTLSYQNGTLTINHKRAQTITFPEISTASLNDVLTLAASASTGLPITYSVVAEQSSATATFDPLETNKVTLDTSGVLTIRAEQGGDDTYNPASPVNRTFVILERTTEPMVWVVDYQGSGSFLTVEEAVLHPIVTSGDTILIRPGLYLHQDELNLDKSLTLISDGTGEVILQRAGQPPKVSKTTNPIWFNTDEYRYSIRVSATDVVIQNITIAAWEREQQGFGWGLGIGASNLTIDNCIFDAVNIRSGIVVYDEVSGFTFTNNTIQGYYYEAFMRGGATNLDISNNFFEQGQWYGGCLYFDDRHPVSGTIDFNYFVYTPGTNNHPEDFNQSGLGFDTIAIFSSKVPQELLIQHNTFAWESVDQSNNHNTRGQATAIRVKEFPGLQSANLNIKDNIFFGYETIVQDSGLKQRPTFHPTGKFGGALDFDGEQAYASFLHPTVEFGTRGSLSMWLKVSNENKRNTLIMGPQGENLAAWNMRNANDKSFEFALNDESQAFFYPNYSDDSDLVKRAFVRTVSLNLEGSWQHLAFSWDKDANGGEGRIYYGGIEQDYDVISGAAGEPRTHADSQLQDLWLNASITTNGLFYIGRDPNDENLLDPDPLETRTYQGLVDELILFNEPIEFNTQANARIREEAFSNNLATYSDKVIAYWDFDDDPGGDTVPDETDRIDLMLGKGWPGFGVIVPEDSLVTNNLFFQNGLNSPNPRDDTALLADDNILADPLFQEGDGGVLSRYGLKNGSPAIRAATNRVDNIGAKQPEPQTIVFVFDERFNDRVYGDTVVLEARTDSGLSVEFEVDDALSEGSGVVVGDVLTITGAGELVLKAKQDGDANFKIADPVEVRFTAQKRPLQVTPVATSIGIGDPIPAPEEFILDITGFVVPTTAFPDPDNRDDLDVEPIARADTAQQGVTGDYPIIPEGGSDNNYTFVYNEGTLSINSKNTQTVTFDALNDMVFGEDVVLNASTDANDPSIQITFSVVSGAEFGNGIVFQENGDTRFLATKVGEVTLRAQASATAQFNASPPVDHTFQITKRQLLVIADNSERPFAQANPEFQWLKTKGDLDGAVSTGSAGVSVGRTGDVYWAGTFEGEIHFPETVQQLETTYEATGTPDLFLARYNNDGTLIWHRHVGEGVGGAGSGFSPVAVSTDINNNVFVIGTFEGSVLIGDQAMSSQSATGDVFILKYTETGDFSWASSVSGASDSDEVSAVASVVNEEGTTYVIGEFKGTIDFGREALVSLPVGNVDGAEPSVDVFVARFSVDNGSLEWVKQIGGPQDDQAGGIALDENQYPVISGTFKDFLILDAEHSLQGTADAQVYLVKFDGTGSFIWSEQLGGDNVTDLRVNHLASGESGKTVISGTFGSEILFEVNEDPHISVGGKDAFYVMHDTFGDLVWADTVGGAEDDLGLASQVAEHNFTHVIGSFTNTMELDGLMDEFDDTQPLSLTAADNGQDVFIVNFDAYGRQIWARQTLGAGAVERIAMDIDDSLNTYIAGSFEKVPTRDPDLTLGLHEVNALGTQDAFLVQLKRDVPTVSFSYGDFFGGRTVNGTTEIYPPDTEAVLDIPPVAVVYETELDDDGNKVVKDNLWQEDAGSGPYLIDFIDGEDDNYEFVYQTGEFSIVRANQYINFFQEFVDIKYQDIIPLTAVATSGLPVEYTIESGKNVAIVLENNKLEIIYVGLVVIRANQPGDDNYLPASPQEQAFLVGKADQEISWIQDLLNVAYGDRVSLEAGTDSGMRVRYEILDTGDGAAEIIDETILFTKVGSGTIRAIQRGSDVFSPADPIELPFLVKKAKLTVWPVNMTRQVGVVDNNFEIEYLESDFRLDDDSRVIENPPTATTVADENSLPGLYTITLVGGEDENYEFDRRTGTLRVSEKAPQQIIFDQDFTGWTYGETYELVASTTSGLPPVFKVVSGEADLNGTSITLQQAGLIVVEISQPGNTQFEEAPDVFGIIDAKRRPLDIIADPKTRYVGEDNPEFTWQAVGLLEGDTVEEEILLIPNVPPSLSTTASENSLATIYPIIVTPGYSENYEHNPVNGTLTVLDRGKGEQEIIWDQDLSSLQFGDEVVLDAYAASLSDPQRNPIEDNDIRYNVISGLNVVQVIGKTLTVIGVGDFTIRAIQRGNDDWNPANEVFRSDTTGKLEQTITWTQEIDPPLAYGSQDFLIATASSGLDVTFSVATDSPGTASIDGPLIIPMNAGELIIVASQGGNENYLPADPITRSFTVDKATVTISVANAFRKAGDPNPEFTPLYDFPLLTDTPQSLTQQAHAVTSATITSFPGDYTISYDVLAQDDRFHFIHQLGKLTVIDRDKEAQTIDFTLDTTDLEVGDFVSLQATASSNLPVEYNILVGEDNIEWIEENSQFVIRKPGIIIIEAIQNGNDFFAPTSSTPVTIDVPLMEQAIFWEQELDNPTYGDTHILNATASSGLSVSYRIPFGQGTAKIEGNEITFTTTGPITVEAYQNGDTQYSAATLTKEIDVEKAVLTIWPEDAVRLFLDPNPAFILVYNETDFKFGDTASDIEPPRASSLATIDTDPGEYPITLNGGSAKNYELNLLQGILTIVDGNKQFQFITFDQLGTGFDFTVGDFTRLTAEATSGFPVSYEVIDGENLFRILEDDDSVMKFIQAGKIMIKATQKGGTKTIINDSGQEEEIEYLPAPAVIKTFTVSGLDQTIIWDQDLSTATFGEIIALEAFATSGLTVTFELLQGEADFVGNEITLTTSSEEIVIQASQGGDEFYLPAPTLIRQFTVNKVPVTIKARNMEWETGSNMPTLRYDLIGLPDGTNANGIFTHEPKLTTTALDSSPPGIYPISVSGAFAEDFTFSYMPGKLIKTDPNRLDQSIIWDQDFDNVDRGDQVFLTAVSSVNERFSIAYELLSGEDAAEIIPPDLLQVNGNGSLTIQASQAGNLQYNPAVAEREIIVEKDAQEILWDQPFTDVTFGSRVELKALSIELRDGSTFQERPTGLPITYRVIAGNAEIENGTHLLVNAPGRIKILATQPGDDSWLPAEAVIREFSAGKGTLVAYAEADESHKDDSLPNLKVRYEIILDGEKIPTDETVFERGDILPIPEIKDFDLIDFSIPGRYTITFSSLGRHKLYDIIHIDGDLVRSEQNQPPHEIVWEQTDISGFIYGETVELSASLNTAGGSLVYEIIRPIGPGLYSQNDLDGNMITLRAAGELIVRVYADASGNFNAAPAVYQFFDVKKRKLQAIVEDTYSLPGRSLPEFRIDYVMETRAPWDQASHINMNDILEQAPVAVTDAPEPTVDGTYQILIEGGSDANYTFEYGSAFLYVRDYADLWGPYPEDDDGWKTIPWFGRIYDYPDSHWIYHECHGLLYGLGFNEDSIWFWDEIMGWVWTSKDTYPWMYRAGPGLWYEEIYGTFEPRWYYYGICTKDPRWFWDDTLEIWTTLLWDDSDGDGMQDGWELEQFGSLDLDGSKDSDRDGLSDLEEYRHGVNPKHPDSDGDGFIDSWEVLHGYGPNDPNSPNDLETP